MADVNKTVDISVKADMKQLLNEFKNMPGMTAKEAKKMVSQLEKEFKAAERAAKKAADTNAAAMKRMGNEAKNAAKDVQQLKKASREMGGALQATGDLVGELDPALGGLVNTVSIAGVAIRDLGKALLTGNPVILAAVGIIGAAAAAYTFFTAEARASEEQQKLLTEAAQKLNEKLSIQRDIANELVIANRNATTELQLFTGQITELQANLNRVRAQGAEELSRQFEKQDEIINNQKQQLDLVQKAKNAYSSLTEEEQKQLDLIAASSQKSFVREGIASNATKRMGQLNRLQEELNIRLDKELQFKAKIKETNDETTKQREELLQLEDEYKREVEEENKRQDRIQKQKTAALKQQAEDAKKAAEAEAEAKKEENRLLQLNAQIFESGQLAKAEAEKTNIDNQRIKISMMDSELEKITANAQLEQDAIQKQIDLIQKQKEENLLLVEGYDQEKLAKEANLELDNQIAELKEQAHLKDMEAQEERLKAIDNEKKKRLELVESIVNQSIAGANAVSEIIKNVSGENKEAAMLAFRVNQAAAIANIAMTTAQKIMEVAPNPFAIAGVTALGIAQGAAVATQPPPEFHMGGVIDKGEDTRNITVLTGEAVLDRRTVQRLGGDAGISQLQRGKMPENKTVVMNPFKHFDRYVKASSQRGGIMNQFSNTKAAGSY